MNTQTLKDRIVLLLINGMSAEAATGFCLQQGVSPDQAGQIVEDARKRITVAADYTRDEQLGKAVMRLEDLYAKSMAAHDIRTALQAQRELNRLLSLYADERRTDPGDDDSETGIRLPFPDQSKSLHRGPGQRSSSRRMRSQRAQGRRYVYGSYIDEVLAMVKANGSSYFYSTNDLYSTYALTDAVGTVVERYMYDPYGSVTICNPDGSEKTDEARVCSAFGNPFFFTGRRNDDETRWFDATKPAGKEWQQGLMYYRNRMYSTNLGRFCARDPIGYMGEQLDLYEYVKGRPIILLDPSGTKGEVTSDNLVWADFQGAVPANAKKDAMTNYTWHDDYGKAAYDCNEVPVDRCAGTTVRKTHVKEDGTRTITDEPPTDEEKKHCWSCTCTFPNLSVTAIFSRNNSWVKPAAQTAALLKHEKGHLAIGEKYAAEVTAAGKAIVGNGLSCSKNSAMIYAQNDWFAKFRPMRKGKSDEDEKANIAYDVAAGMP